MWLAVQTLITDICDIMKGLFSMPASFRRYFVNSEAEVEESPLPFLLIYATPVILLLYYFAHHSIDCLTYNLILVQVVHIQDLTLHNSDPG